MKPTLALGSDAAGVIAELPRYPKTAESGVKWLGKVPAHWEMRRLRYAVDLRLSNVDKHLRDNEQPVRLCNYMDVYTNDRILADIAFMPASATQAEIDRFRLRRGDVLITKDSEDWADIGVPALVVLPSAETEILCGYHCALLRPHHGLQGAYLFWLLNSSVGTDQLRRRANGVTRYGLSKGTLGSVRLPLPPLAEQTAIVRFLDYVGRRIRRYIRPKEKLIALLEEQKQAVIHQAVTGQIDVRTDRPYPAYKDSEVEWLDRVPAHWRVSKLRRLALDRCDGPFGSGLKSSHYTEDGVRVVRLQNIGHAEFRNSDRAYISHRHYSSLGDHSVLARDLLIAGLGDRNHPAGRACVAPEDLGPAMVKADCFRFRLDEDRVEPRFAALQLTATAAAAAAVLSTGATRQRINLQSTSARPLALPPPNEQRALVQHIDLHVAGLRRNQDTAVRQMALLRELRMRLIADVITGRLDVRAAAAALPEVEPSPNGCAPGAEPVPDASASGKPTAVQQISKT